MPFKKIKNVLELIKFSHSIFALPFALGSVLIASKGQPSWIQLVRIALALVFARTAAMAFNRLVDAKFDAKNPRTESRHLPQKIISKQFTITLIVISSLAFIYISWLLAKLCFFLSPLVLAVLFLYSYTKRFTHYTQLFLGFALGIAPIGAWIAMTGSISITPIFLGLAVLFWVAGFDILYSAQDYQFDKVSGLHSMVVKFGIDKAFHLARAMHLFSFFLLLATGLVANLHWPYFLGLLVMTVLFFRQHLLVNPKNLSRIDAAFFESNGLISLLFLASVYFGI